MSRARLIAGVVLAATAVVATTPAFAAPWKNSASLSSGTLGVATVTTSMSVTAGYGSVTGNVYTVGGLLGGYGYVDIVNTSTVPVGTVISVQLAALLAGTNVTACTVPWNVAGTGTCAGTSTVIADGGSLLVPTVAYSAAISPPGSHVYLRCAVGGLLAGISVTMSTPITRAPVDRT